MHLADDVHAVDDERPVARQPQRDVQRRAILGRVDVLAAVHRVAAPCHVSRRRERDEQPHGLLGDEVLREIGVDAGGLERESLDASRVGGEELAQVAVAHVRVMTDELPPGVAVDEGVGHLVSAGLGAVRAVDSIDSRGSDAGGRDGDEHAGAARDGRARSDGGEPRSAGDAGRSPVCRHRRPRGRDRGPRGRGDDRRALRRGAGRDARGAAHGLGDGACGRRHRARRRRARRPARARRHDHRRGQQPLPRRHPARRQSSPSAGSTTSTWARAAASSGSRAASAS